MEMMAEDVAAQSLALPQHAGLRPAEAELATAAPRVLPRRKSWLVRGLLVHADLFALLLAFFVAEQILDPAAVAAGSLSTRGGLFLLTLPAWIVGAKLLGRVDARDGDGGEAEQEERAGVPDGRRPAGVEGCIAEEDAEREEAGHDERVEQHSWPKKQ